MRRSWLISYSNGPLERAANQFLHDLVGAAVDLLHARIGVEARDRVLPHVAVAAEELQALVYELALQVGGPVLGHRGGGDVELAFQMPGQAVVDEHACDMPLGLELGELEAGVLEIDDRLAEGLAFLD